MSFNASNPSETPSGRRSPGLTPERIRLLAECLIAGCTRTETADALEVSPRTVTRWKKDTAVRAEVERLRNRTGETRASDVLIASLDSWDERIALSAAKEILRLKIQRMPVEPEPQPEPNVREGYMVVRREPIP
jgi:hypothetical protein